MSDVRLVLFGALLYNWFGRTTLLALGFISFLIFNGMRLTIEDVYGTRCGDLGPTEQKVSASQPTGVRKQISKHIALKFDMASSEKKKKKLFCLSGVR